MFIVKWTNIIRVKCIVCLVLLFVAMPLIATSGAVSGITPDEARAVAKEAYVYGFPMVMNYKTLYRYAIDKKHPEYKGPFNQLFIGNPLDRYLLNSDMMDRFKLEEGGSLVLHIGKDSPGEDLAANWLPAPGGPFYMVMRLYGPEKAALEGRWTPPNVKKAGGSAGKT